MYLEMYTFVSDNLFIHEQGYLKNALQGPFFLFEKVNSPREHSGDSFIHESFFSKIW